MNQLTIKLRTFLGSQTALFVSVITTPRTETYPCACCAQMQEVCQLTSIDRYDMLSAECISCR